MKRFLYAVIGMGMMMMMLCCGIGLFFTGDRQQTAEPPKSTAELRKEQIEKQFSAWDGSHPALTKVIKESMNDPDSFQHVKTVYWDKGDHLVVTTTFRGKNAFGGVVENWVQAKVDIDGNVQEIIAQGP